MTSYLSDNILYKKSVVCILFVGYLSIYYFVFLRSAKVLDLTKIIPTISGASLNMTVLLTASMGLNVTAKADVSQYMRRTGPVQGTGELSMG